MGLLAIFQTLVEVVLIGFVLWGFLNERRLVAMERRIIRMIKKKLAKV